MNLRVKGLLMTFFSSLFVLSTLSLMDARLPTRISRQPVTFAQRQRLVNPDEPAVQKILREVLGDSIYNPADMPRTVTDISALRDWAGGIQYVLDVKAHGTEDYWQTPAETIRLGAGDCEDISILFVSLLRAYGVPADGAYVAVGYNELDNWHAWVFERCFMRAWRSLDPEGNVTPYLLASGVAPYKIAYCFNDKRGFNGLPSDSPVSHIALCGNSSYPWGPPASAVYRRSLAAGEKVSASVEWLVADAGASSWEEIVFPWSLSLYDESGSQLVTWSGTDARHTLEFTAKTAGIYFLEIIKQDNDSRYFRLDTGSKEWMPEPPDSFISPLASPKYDVRELQQYQPDGLTREIKNPPPPELLEYTLRLINEKRAPYADKPFVTVPVPTVTVTMPPALPLALGSNPSAQAHAEDMLARRYYAFWDSNGLMPSLNHGLYGSNTWGDGAMYLCKVGWNGPKDSLYLDYLKSLLAGAIDALSSGGYGSPEGYDLLDPGYTSVSIGLAWDDEYLFLVLDYEYPQSLISDGPPALEDGVVTLSGRQVPMNSLGGFVYVYYFRMPETLTPAQLNATGRDYPALSYGRLISMMGRYLSQNLGAQTVDQAPLRDPADFPADGVNPGLESRGPLLTSSPYAYQKASRYNATVPGWDASQGRYYIRLDLSKIMSTLGPGIYTVSLYSYTVGANNVVTRNCQTQFSFFVR